MSTFLPQVSDGSTGRGALFTISDPRSAEDASADGEITTRGSGQTWTPLHSRKSSSRSKKPQITISQKGFTRYLPVCSQEQFRACTKKDRKHPGSRLMDQDNFMKLQYKLTKYLEEQSITQADRIRTQADRIRELEAKLLERDAAIGVAKSSIASLTGQVTSLQRYFSATLSTGADSAENHDPRKNSDQRSTKLHLPLL